MEFLIEEMEIGGRCVGPVGDADRDKGVRGRGSGSEVEVRDDSDSDHCMLILPFSIRLMKLSYVTRQLARAHTGVATNSRADQSRQPSI